MHAFQDLFTSDAGLMSVAGLAFILAMAVYFGRYFLTPMRDDAARAERPRAVPCLR